MGSAAPAVPPATAQKYTATKIQKIPRNGRGTSFEGYSERLEDISLSNRGWSVIRTGKAPRSPMNMDGKVFWDQVQEMALKMASPALRAYSDPSIFRNDRVLRTLLKRELKLGTACSAKTFYSSVQVLFSDVSILWCWRRPKKNYDMFIPQTEVKPGMRQEVNTFWNHTHVNQWYC